MLHTLNIEIYDETTSRFAVRHSVAGDRGKGEGSAWTAAAEWLAAIGKYPSDSDVRLIPWDWFREHDIAGWRSRWDPQPSDVVRLVVEYDVTGWTAQSIAAVRDRIEACTSPSAAPSFREITRDQQVAAEQPPPVPEGYHRIEVKITAECDLDESWTIDATPDLLQAALDDHDGDLQAAARYLVMIAGDGDGVRLVRQDDDGVNNERERVAYRVNGWPGLVESVDLVADWPRVVTLDSVGHPAHDECADGCGINLDHDGACLDKPGGTVMCAHPGVTG